MNPQRIPRTSAGYIRTNATSGPVWRRRSRWTPLVPWLLGVVLGFALLGLFA